MERGKLTALSIFWQYLVCSTSAFLLASKHHRDAIARPFSSPDLLIIWKEPGWGRSLLVCREAFVLSEDLLDVRFGFRHDLQLFPLLCKVSVGLLEIQNGELGIGDQGLGIRDHM